MQMLNMNSNTSRGQRFCDTESGIRITYACQRRQSKRIHHHHHHHQNTPLEPEPEPEPAVKQKEQNRHTSSVPLLDYVLLKPPGCHNRLNKEKLMRETGSAQKHVVAMIMLVLIRNHFDPNSNVHWLSSANTLPTSAIWHGDCCKLQVQRRCRWR